MFFRDLSGGDIVLLKALLRRRTAQQREPGEAERGMGGYLQHCKGGWREGRGGYWFRVGERAHTSPSE